MLTELFKAGGAGGVNIEFVKDQMEGLVTSLSAAGQHPSKQGVKMPAYFALIMRAFGTIEG